MQVGGSNRGRTTRTHGAVQIDDVSGLQHFIQREHTLGQLPLKIRSVEVINRYIPEGEICCQGYCLFPVDPVFGNVVLGLEAQNFGNSQRA